MWITIIILQTPRAAVYQRERAVRATRVRAARTARTLRTNNSSDVQGLGTKTEFIVLFRDIIGDDRRDATKDGRDHPDLHAAAVADDTTNGTRYYCNIIMLYYDCNVRARTQTDNIIL